MEIKNKDDLVQRLNKLKRIYDSYVKEWSSELQSYLDKSATWTIEDTENLQLLVHKLTGTGATYGYGNITDAARSLEYKLAYANLEFRTRSINPNTNIYVLKELESLTIICSNIHAENMATKKENASYDQEIDQFIHAQQLDTNHKTILVVDDHEIVRQTLSASLKTAGFNIIEANDGDDALLIMEKKIPDLVVLDRMMPNLDGLTVLKTMRKVKSLKHVPVIFLTAMYNPSDILEAEKLGSVDYVAKPFDTDEFVMRCIRQL